MLERDVEQNVLKLHGEVEAGSLAFVDELREPGVIDVAGQVAGFDAAVPEAWHDEQHGDGHGGVRPANGRTGLTLRR